MISFVDTHVHFWDPARISYPWLAQVPSIAGAHGPGELRAAAGAGLPERLVFVEAGAEPDDASAEVGWIEEMAGAEPRVAAIVAFAPVDRGGETTRRLEALAARPLVHGVRHNFQDEPDPDFCRRPAFVDGVRAAGARGLSFDLCLRHHQLRAAADLVRACPGTAFVLDHAGKPDIRGRRLDPWRADLAELARLPNVSCKLSGLVTEADPVGWTAADLRPYADHLLACFGPGRVMFGSDWPVVDLAAGYQRWLETAAALLEPLAPADRQAVWSGNARRVYRLP